MRGDPDAVAQQDQTGAVSATVLTPGLPKEVRPGLVGIQASQSGDAGPGDVHRDGRVGQGHAARDDLALEVHGDLTEPAVVPDQVLLRHGAGEVVEEVRHRLGSGSGLDVDGGPGGLQAAGLDAVGGVGAQLQPCASLAVRGDQTHETRLEGHHRGEPQRQTFSTAHPVGTATTPDGVVELVEVSGVK